MVCLGTELGYILLYIVYIIPHSVPGHTSALYPTIHYFERGQFPAAMATEKDLW